MISLLVVDDDSSKRQQVRALVEEMVGEQAAVTECGSVAEAAAVLRERSVDLLVLDLNLPQRSGEEPRRDGGSRLMELLAGGTLRKPTHIIGLTAFDELLERARPAFSADLWHVVRYEPASDGWFDAIGRKVSYIVDCKTRTPDVGYNYDLAIVTALTSVELEAVLNLPAQWVQKTFEGDDTPYFVGEAKGEGWTARIAAAAAFEVGMPAASVAAMKLIQHFRPRVLAMSGIAAGVKGRLGDILVADKAWDYGCGKNRQIVGRISAFFPQPTQIGVHPSLRAKLALFCTKKEWLKKIEDSWKGTEERAALDVRIGGIASGAAVLENGWLVDDIVARDRKVVGIEMETYAVFMAGLLCTEPRPMVMAAKSICDFAGKDKSDDHQRYAAYTSANFVWAFGKDSLWPRA